MRPSRSAVETNEIDEIAIVRVPRLHSRPEWRRPSEEAAPDGSRVRSRKPPRGGVGLSYHRGRFPRLARTRVRDDVARSITIVSPARGSSNLRPEEKRGHAQGTALLRRTAREDSFRRSGRASGVVW